jgi:hypothetical protein
LRFIGAEAQGAHLTVQPDTSEAEIGMGAEAKQRVAGDGVEHGDKAGGQSLVCTAQDDFDLKSGSRGDDFSLKEFLSTTLPVTLSMAMRVCTVFCSRAAGMRWLLRVAELGNPGAGALGLGARGLT